MRFCLWSCKADRIGRWEHSASHHVTPHWGRDAIHQRGKAMTQQLTKTGHRPAWVDLSSREAAGSRDFYSKLFSWQIDVNPDPKYGGYGRATLMGRDAAGITPTQTKDQ